MSTDIVGEAMGCTVDMFHDLQRFVMMFMDPIVMSTLHIYSTALVLMPSGTQLLQKYREYTASGPRVVRGCAEGWPQTLWIAAKHSRTVGCVVVSPDGRTIISGSYDNTLHLWDARTGAAIGEAMKGHTDWVTCVAVSPDGTTIVSGSDDNTLCLWEARIGAAIELAMKGHTNSVTCVAVSPDGTTIVSGSYDNTLHLWDAKTGAAIGAAMGGHTN
ncbi:POC1 centriolar protein A [Tulasnella sp. JGI-2019a]|nr:POC1 centriolar protein A [Tulasnella sp. JGI-2019a]